MFRIRKVRTKSGATAKQVVQYHGHRAKIAKHIGSCKENIEYELLMKKAQEWIEDQTSQTNIFPEPKQMVLIVERGECVAVTHHFAYQFFMSCLNECNFSYLPPLLLDLAIIRLIEPASKFRSIELLFRYFGIHYSQRFYRTMPKLILHKADIEQRAYSVAEQKFKEQFYCVI